MQAISLFVQSLKSPYTQKTYTYELNRFCKTLGVDYDKLLSLGTKDIEMKLIEYLIGMRQAGKSYHTCQLAFSAVKHFLSINDVVINKEKVAKFLGENVKTVQDRAYTTDEISQLLTKCDERKRVMILLMASGGMRIGALAGLKLKHLEKRSEGYYKLSIYHGTRSQYTTFCSVECALAIDSYLEYRQRYGEKLKSDSPLIRDQFDRNDPFHSATAKVVSPLTLTRMMQRLLIDSGFRQSAVVGQKYQRKEIMTNHGLRKFFATQLNGAYNNENPLMVEMLLGHDTGLTGVYTKPSDETKEKFYVGGMDALTINEENRLKRENVQLKRYSDDVTTTLQQATDLIKQMRAERGTGEL